jgi:uncharacterized protein (TIGR02996 family)
VDNATLLTEVLEHPEDEAPRLAYADWCKQNGDADRAEFIRIQCRRAARDPYDKTQDGLAKKENTLLKKHGQRWQADVRQWGCVDETQLPNGVWAAVNPRFRRGFVAHMTLSPELFVKRGAELLRLTPLEALEVYGEFDVEAVRALAQCPHAARLTDLDFAFSSLNNEGVKALAASPYLSRLRFLRCNTVVTDAGIKALAATQHLTGLTALHCYYTIGMPALKALQTAPFRLRELSVQLPPGGAAVLAGMPNMGDLTSLLVNCCELDADGARALAASPHLTNLQRLDIGHNPLTTAGVEAIAQSPTFTNLRELHLENSNLGEDAILALARSPYLTQLKILGLVNNERISDAAVQELKNRFGAAAATHGYY